MHHHVQAIWAITHKLYYLEARYRQAASSQGRHDAQNVCFAGLIYTIKYEKRLPYVLYITTEHQSDIVDQL